MNKWFNRADTVLIVVVLLTAGYSVFTGNATGALFGVIVAGQLISNIKIRNLEEEVKDVKEKLTGK